MKRRTYSTHKPNEAKRHDLIDAAIEESTIPRPANLRYLAELTGEHATMILRRMHIHWKYGKSGWEHRKDETK